MVVSLENRTLIVFSRILLVYLVNHSPCIQLPWHGKLSYGRIPATMAFHPRQNSMLHFTFYFSHFILHLLFDIRVYTFVIQLSSCNIQVFALYNYLFGRDIQVHVQVQRVVFPCFRIQYWAFGNQVFAFSIWLYVFHLQVCIVRSIL